MSSPALSLCIINRDDRANLVRLIKAARQHVSEIVVVDTGSRDGSAFAARRAGADLVRESPELLVNGELRSFSQARQLSYDLSTCPWQMWLDTDDDLSSWEMLGAIVSRADVERRSRGQALSVRMWYDYSWNEDRSRCTQSFTRERITHRDDNWTWRCPVHEFLERKGETYKALVNAPRVVHQSQGARGIENDRNLKILKRWRAEGGEREDPNMLFYYLGDEMRARERCDEAIDFFERVQGPGRWYELSQFRIVRSLERVERLDEAYQRLLRLEEEMPNVANFKWELSLLLYNFKHHAEAKEVLESSAGCREIESEDTIIRDTMCKLLGVKL